MEPNTHVNTISMLTLGVKDLAKARSFYEKGFKLKASSISNEHFVAFHMQGALLSLCEEEFLAEDAMAKKTTHDGFRGVTFSHNVASKEEVDQVIQQAVEAGGKLEKQAQDVFWGGYSGYFSDPDGYFWEVAWNPHWPLSEEGALQLPQ